MTNPSSSFRPIAIASVVIVLITLLVPVGTAGATSNGVMFGAYAQPRNGQSGLQAAQALEASLGAQLPVVRSFGRFDSAIDSNLNRWAADGGRVVMAGISTKLSSGRVLTWREIADAPSGSAIHGHMVDLARSAKRVDGEVWVVFNHEPEASFNQSRGDAPDFIAAWRRLHNVFADQGAEVKWLWTMTSWSFEVARINPNDRRVADRWYPGDGYVDFLGADPYNWNNCRGNPNETWTSLEDTIRPFFEWSSRHPSKQLVLPEFGSVEGGPGAKAQWLRDAADLLQRPAWRDKFAAVVYFHDDHSDTAGGTSCRWWLDSSSSALDAARSIVNDPFFSGRSSSPPPPATSPPATSPPATSPPATSPPATSPPTTTTSAPPASPPTTNARAPRAGDGPPAVAPTPQPTPPPPPVMCNGLVATIVGSAGPDVIVGTDGDDVIAGLGGRDRIDGRGGDDVICGGAGNDVLLGGDGFDRIDGQDGRDILRGGMGNDSLIGGRQRDRVAGGPGRDRLAGGAGRDHLLGNAGIDRLSGGAGTDGCTGGPDRDRILDDCEYTN